MPQVGPKTSLELNKVSASVMIYIFFEVILIKSDSVSVMFAVGERATNKLTLFLKNCCRESSAWNT